jgi:apolipoprotein N-acyltransferase
VANSSAADNRTVGLAFAFTLLSWLGELIHNRYELPQLAVLSPETSLPAVVSLVLFVAWPLSQFNHGIAALLLLWAAVQLIGGAIVSVIPFGFLPYYPRQTLDHYAVHAVYGLAQIPLIVLMLSQLRPQKRVVRERT